MDIQASLKTNFDAMKNGTSKTHDHRREHLGHCFDYLRQAVLCAGDMALEPATEDKHTGIRGVSGWNVTHQCKDRQKIYDFALQHRYSDSGGVL